MATDSPRSEPPPLPTPCVWVRPTRCRHPSLECIAVEWGETGRVVAMAGRGSCKSWTVLGVHRALRSEQHYREFTSYSTAMRYLAAWVTKYADQLAAELHTTHLQYRDRV